MKKIDVTEERQKKLNYFEMMRKPIKGQNFIVDLSISVDIRVKTY